MGGLGNKFFQLARAIELLNNGYEVEVVSIEKKMNFLYSFSGHTIHDEWLDIKKLSKRLNVNYRSIKFFELIFLGYKFFLKKIGFSINFDTKLHELANLYSYKMREWDIGYFQSTKHINLSSINIVVDGLISTLKIARNTDRELVCHIRGGDFNQTDRLQKSSVSKVFDIVRNKDLSLIVITDDKNYCEELIKNYDYSFNDGLTALEDFVKLASSEYLFLSNSTFSLWAGLIALRSHNASIYVPDKWNFKDILEDC